MNPENTKYLGEKYPLLYRGLRNPKERYGIRYGFECGDGWFKLLDVLSAKLEALIAATEPDEDGLRPYVHQVKEKFGGLRFYMDRRESEEMSEAIREAEKAAYQTCEGCGEPGTYRNMHWIRVACDACDAAYMKEQADRDAKYK